MTELAALNIKITGDASALKAAVAAAQGDLGKLAAAANAAGLKVTGLGNKFTGAGAAAGNFSNMARGAAQQLSQVGQQTMATGNFIQALAIQLPDIGLAFGAVGTAAGLLAGIALPMLASAFFATSEDAAALADATRELADATAAFRVQADAIRFGVDEDEVIKVRELNSLMADLARINAEWQATDSLGARQRLSEEASSIKANISLVQKELDAYRAARAELSALEAKAKGAADKVAGIAANAVSATGAITALVASAPQGGWLSGAISDAQALASSLWNAAAAKAAISVKGTAFGQGGTAPPNVPVSSEPAAGVVSINIPSGGGVGAGGGGGGANPILAELESLRSGLASAEQLQIESYTRQQETLTSALEQRLITQQEYAAMMEQAGQQHADKMTAIDVYRYGTGLDIAGAFFGDMADAMASGNDKMLAISKAFGAAQALISAWQGAAEALKLPFPGNLAAFAKVLATGLGAVNAIKSVGKGGGGGGATGGGGAAPAASAGDGGGTYLNFSFTGGWASTEQMGRFIVGAINQAVENGAVIKGARIT